MKNKYKKHKFKYKYLVAPMLLVMSFTLSIVCASFNQTMYINGQAYARVNRDVRIVSIERDTVTNYGYSTYNPKYAESSVIMYDTLPTLNSTVTYKIKIRNNTNNYINVYDVSNTVNNSISNASVTYEFDKTSLNSTYGSDLITPHTEQFVYVTVKYKSGVSLPETAQGKRNTSKIKFSFAPIYASELSYSNSTYTTCTEVQCALDHISRMLENQTELKVGDYVRMTPTVTSYTIDDTKTGCSESNSTCSNSGDYSTQNLTLWRVIKVNLDGTADAISHYVDSNDIYFYGLTGYKNYIGVLNEIAKKFENPNYTVGSRMPGYSNQTQYITNTSYLDNTNASNHFNCATSSTCSNSESLGGGDMAYLDDYNAILTAYNKSNCTAVKVGTSSSKSYFLASRTVTFNSSTSFPYSSQFKIRSCLSSSSSVVGPAGPSMFQRNINSSNQVLTSNYNVLSSDGRGIRPIVVFKPIIQASSGDGSFSNPYVP